MFDKFMKQSEFLWRKLKDVFEVLQIQMWPVISDLVLPEEILSLFIYNKWKDRYFLYQKHSSEIKFNNIPLKI